MSVLDMVWIDAGTPVLEPTRAQVKKFGMSSLKALCAFAADTGQPITEAQLAELRLDVALDVALV